MVHATHLDDKWTWYVFLAVPSGSVEGAENDGPTAQARRRFLHVLFYTRKKRYLGSCTTAVVHHPTTTPSTATLGLLELLRRIQYHTPAPLDNVLSTKRRVRSQSHPQPCVYPPPPPTTAADPPSSSSPPFRDQWQSSATLAAEALATAAGRAASAVAGGPLRPRRGHSRRLTAAAAPLPPDHGGQATASGGGSNGQLWPRPLAVEAARLRWRWRQRLSPRRWAVGTQE